MRQPAEVGERFTLKWRIATADVPRFAASVHDFNPLHHDEAAARAAGYPGLIACGPHLGGIFMGMTATHFARAPAPGVTRSGLGMGFEIRFRAPVYPEEDIDLHWTVTAVQRKDRLDGWVTTMDGEARSARALLLSGTGTLLLRLKDRHAAE